MCNQLGFKFVGWLCVRAAAEVAGRSVAGLQGCNRSCFVTGDLFQRCRRMQVTVDSSTVGISCKRGHVAVIQQSTP